LRLPFPLVPLPGLKVRISFAPEWPWLLPCNPLPLSFQIQARVLGGVFSDGQPSPCKDVGAGTPRRMFFCYTFLQPRIFQTPTLVGRPDFLFQKRPFFRAFFCALTVWTTIFLTICFRGPPPVVGDTDFWCPLDFEPRIPTR